MPGRKKQRGGKIARWRRARQQRRRTAEWVGGRHSLPGYVDGSPPHKPDILLWLELPDNQIVYSKLVEPTEPRAAFGESYLEAMKNPLVGPHRQPTRIRVANDDLAIQMRHVAGDVPVVVAPTPELDEIVEMFAASLPDDGEYSYLGGGDIPEEHVERIFEHAAILYRMKPWKALSDHLVRMDIPSLGVEGAGVAIMDDPNERGGLVFLPSQQAVAALAVEGDVDPDKGMPSFGDEAEWIALAYERAVDIPEPMLEEVREHAWTVADSTAYPVVSHFTKDGTPRPADAEDIYLVALGLSAFASFFAMHRKLFETKEPEPVSVSYMDDEDVVVRFTLPYESFDTFEDATGSASQRRRQRPAARFDRPAPRAAKPSTATRRVGRNERCPCGSGKKYKHCHLDADENGSATAASTTSLHDMDRDLVIRILTFAAGRFPHLDRIVRLDSDTIGFAELLLTWSAYACEVQGIALSEWFRKDNKSRLSHAEHEWLDAQRRAWLSVWEVTGVRPGEGLDLRDLLTGETRSVVERNASETVMLRHAMLGRVVDYNGLSILCGCHPRPLEPADAHEVVQRIRKRLRRKRLVPVDKMRPEKLQRFMIRRWNDAVEDMELKRNVPRIVQNTDGHEIVFTVDSFQFDASNRAAVLNRLWTIDGVVQDDDDRNGSEFVFQRPGNPEHRSWENMVVGHARLEEGVLRIESNSVERAADLRKLVVSHCEGLVRHGGREEKDIESAMQALDAKERPAARRARDEPPDPELIDTLLQYKRQHYESWLDASIPALEGKTPRQVAATRLGRERLDLLLKEMENHEARIPAAERFDFGLIRRVLALEL